MKKTILIGVTSGIAAFKSLELIRLLKEEGLEIFVVMTAHAAKMVPREEFEKASGNDVFIELFSDGFDYKKVLQTRTVDHIKLADRADLFVIVPATANIIGKLAHGIADDAVTTTALAVTAPILICPSMNVNMWHNSVVQENISRLKALDYIIVEPVEGMLACGYEGKGRLEEIEIIKDEIIQQLNRTNSLKDKKIIVTAGATLEKIDDVRFITNRSSGKMGIALAEACCERGAQVLLLRSTSSVKPRYAIPEETFDTAEELLSLIKEKINQFDMIFHVAAVGDFAVENKNSGKVSSKNSFDITLTPQLKILDQIKKLNPHIYLVGFKAEYKLSEKELIIQAKKRLLESHAEAIVANDVGKPDRGFQTNTNEVFIILKNGTYKKIPLTAKRVVALHILDFIITHI